MLVRGGVWGRGPTLAVCKPQHARLGPPRAALYLCAPPPAPTKQSVLACVLVGVDLLSGPVHSPH